MRAPFDQTFNQPLIRSIVCTALAAVLVLIAYTALAQTSPPPLKSVPIPGPSPEELGKYVRSKQAALQLGKALFWDTRLGSDNRTACASCHFHAGADNRIKNQLNPGVLAGDKIFQLGGPNYTLKPDDFPFTKFARRDDLASKFSDVNEVVSSQGVYTRVFIRAGNKNNPEVCKVVSDAVFHGGTGFNVNGINTRRVEPRNAPSIINSIFNFRNFWDGRAAPVANGGDPFGLRNPNALVWIREGNALKRIKIAMPNASLAALGSGPPLSENEMSCRNRTLAMVARKLLSIAPLADQAIARNDSVLGPLAVQRTTYSKLIEQAFRPEFWSSPAVIDLTDAEAQHFAAMDLKKSLPIGGDHSKKGDRITQMEANFGLFLGIGFQLYAATLVSDDTPFDRFAAGNTRAMTVQQQRGLSIFQNEGRCAFCHSGAEFTSASFGNILRAGRLASRTGSNQQVIRSDTGFFNTGVRPTLDDIGLGGIDPFGNPLSETRMSQQGKTQLLGAGFDPARETPVAPNAATAVDGAFKTPGLRNVALTGPYFHNGGAATLMQVVDFYNRGGDFGIANGANFAPMVPLGLTQAQKEDLVAFMLALTDDRVSLRRAPFDHPSICVPVGHLGDHRAVATQTRNTREAIDQLRCLPAVGANGASTRLAPFLNLDPFKP